MASSLFNLAGRKHPFVSDVVIAVPSAAAEQAQIVEADLVDLVEETASVISIEEAVSDEMTVADEAVETVPVWQATWSRTKLLAVAAQLNLEISSDISKNELIAALKVATGQ